MNLPQIESILTFIAWILNLCLHETILHSSEILSILQKSLNLSNLKCIHQNIIIGLTSLIIILLKRKNIKVIRRQ